MQIRNSLNFILSLIFIFLVFRYVPFTYDIFSAFSTLLIAILVAEWLMGNTRKHILHKTVCPENKAILITGCDSGFGQELAKRMDRWGYKVFAACLNKVGSGAKELIADCSDNLTVLQMDVTNDQEIQEAKEFVINNLRGNDFWAIVNNAGIGQAGPIEWSTMESYRAVYEVNALGIVRVTKAFLPLIKQSKGRVVNLTSMGGRLHCPIFVGYCMSKSAGVAFTTGLRMELAKWGVTVVGVEPFFYSTPLTSAKSSCDLIEESWKNAPEDIKEDYGEHYKGLYKKRTVQCLNAYNNPRTYEVVDCLEDAIVAEEPLLTYNPRHWVLKIVISLALILPSWIHETVQRIQCEPAVKPVALMRRK